MHTSFLADPTWERLGYDNPPDVTRSGKGIGIVITDTVINHPFIRHLSGRLKRVTVNDDLSIECRDVVMDEPEEVNPFPNYAEHGMMALFLLAHLPFEINNKRYVGLAPQATFIMVDEQNPIRLKKAMEWVIKRRDKWNLKLVINLLVIGHIGIRPPHEEPYVQAMMPAVEADLLVIQANGNSQVITNNSPREFFAVGGYDDQGLRSAIKKVHPSSSTGKNGEGHMRPDILAPYTNLPAPYYKCKKTDLAPYYMNSNDSESRLSYFGGSCGSATLIGGICANLLSKYPHLSINELRHSLIQGGTEVLDGNKTALAVNINETLKIINKVEIEPSQVEYKSYKNNFESDSIEEIKCSIALTKLIEEEEISRGDLWELASNPSHYVQKVAIWGLHKPINNEEKKFAQTLFNRLIDQGKGVRESWAYMILFGSKDNDLDWWMGLITDSSTDIRLCVKHFLNEHYSNAPILQHTPDTSQEMIKKIALPVQQWYQKRDY